MKWIDDIIKLAEDEKKDIGTVMNDYIRMESKIHHEYATKVKYGYFQGAGTFESVHLKALSSVKLLYLMEDMKK